MNDLDYVWTGSLLLCSVDLPLHAAALPPPALLHGGAGGSLGLHPPPGPLRVLQAPVIRIISKTLLHYYLHPLQHFHCGVSQQPLLAASVSHS